MYRAKQRKYILSAFDPKDLQRVKSDLRIRPSRERSRPQLRDECGPSRFGKKIATCRQVELEEMEPTDALLVDHSYEAYCFTICSAIRVQGTAFILKMIIKDEANCGKWPQQLLCGHFRST